MESTLEIRKLSPSYLRNLVAILEYKDHWKKLMAIIPKVLQRESYVCDIKPDNLHKYNPEHFRMIESAAIMCKTSCTEILFNEWGTSGKVRPALGHLLHLLTKAELYRAADYVAVVLLKQQPPARPSEGPAALISLEKGVPVITGSSIYSTDNIPAVVNNRTISATVPSRSSAIPNVTKLISSPGTANALFSNKRETANIPNISALLESDKSAVIPNMTIFNHNTQTNEYIPVVSAKVLHKRQYVSSVKSPLDSPDLCILAPSLHNSLGTPSNFRARGNSLESSENIRGLRPSRNHLVVTSTDFLSESSNTADNKSGLSNLSKNISSPLTLLSFNTMLPHFFYSDLENATNGFNTTSFTSEKEVGRFLGSGAFGSVFLALGLLDRPVAVKKLVLDRLHFISVDNGVAKQFKNEVEVLSRFKHENLLSLLGYSCDGRTYCLVYEYVPGGALNDRLQIKEPKLIWTDRLHIALGTARAITYLHSAFRVPLVHRDIKSANILLDLDNKPKLGDFGLIKLQPGQNSNTTITISGTSIYMAPEAFRGNISVKLDTFSFGVVLLELLTSLPPLDESREYPDLISHVENNCEECIDPLLDKRSGSWKAMDTNFSEVLYLSALKCLENRKKRPKMQEVATMLEELIEKLL